MNPPLLWDCMPAILAFAFGMFAFGGLVGLLAGYCWGSARTSGQDGDDRRRLVQTINNQQETIERLRNEVKFGMSVD